MTNKIFDAMSLVQEYSKKHGVAQRGGKIYTQVVHRMEAFRQVFGIEFGVDTQILVDDGQRVVVKAIITNENGIVIGSGMAEEIRGAGHVNKTSALENCETSAVGRALASIGLSGGEYASANEIEAVGRKEQNLKNQAGSEKPVGSPPPSAPASPPSEPPQQSDDNEDADRKLYLEVAGMLPTKKARASVEDYFGKMKPRLDELKARQPDRYQHILQLFLDRLDQV